MTPDDELVRALAREWKSDRDEEARAIASGEARSPNDAAIVDRVVAGASASLAKGTSDAKKETRAKIFYFAPPLALAAAVLLYVSVGRGPAPIPAYDATWNAGDVAQRSDDATGDVLKLSRESRFELVLRPSTAVSGPIEVHGFLLRGAEARPWSPPFEVSTDGAVHVAGSVRELFGGESGGWTVAVAVGRAGSVPSEGSGIVEKAKDAKGAWQVFTRKITLVD